MADPDQSSDHHAAALALAAERAADLVPQGDLLGFEDTPKALAVRERRAGRPPGARNRRSEDVARFVIEQLGDPLVQMAALATMPVAELAASIGCTVAEALVEKRLAAGLVIPYLHRRMPIQVDVNNRTFVQLFITDGPGGEPVAGHASDIIEIMDYQQVSEVPNDAV